MPKIPAANYRVCETYHWLREGDTLQVLVDDKQARLWNVQGEKNHWYLTADFSGDKPKLFLSKEAKKYSHWDFLDKDILVPKEITRFHLRNREGDGKPRWLGMEAKGVRYKGHIEIRKPELLEAKQDLDFYWRSGY